LCFSHAQAGVEKDLQTWLDRTGVEATPHKPPLVACSLWGDSAPYSSKDSVHLLIMTLVSGIHHVWWWVVAFGKQAFCRCGCKGKCTYEGIWRILAWSFRAAAAGVHPSFDHRGNKFRPDSYLGQLVGSPMHIRGALVSKRGDWQWLKATLGLCGWRGEGPLKRICWLCQACLGGDCPAYDFTSAACWRTKLFDMKKFWAAHQVFVSLFWSVPGFCISFCKPDWMHVCCLGILQYAIGCAMWELFVFMGGTMKRSISACSKLLCMIRAMSKDMEMDCPITDLTVCMFRAQPSKKPKMKLKAAEGRLFF